MPLLKVTGLTKRFDLDRPRPFAPRPVVTAVADVSFTIERGEIFGLVGESGSGKSTVGMSVLQLLRPSAGSVRFNGTELTALSPRSMRPMRKLMQMVFQDPYASLNPRMRIGAMLRESLELHSKAASEAELVTQIEGLLEQVGLDPSHAHRYPHEFSGGQRQRIGIARALASSPELIVADEPTSALDVSVRAQIVELLAELRQSTNLAMLFISHDLAIVGYLADRVGVMYLGRLVEVGPAEDVLNTPKHPYTQALVAAIPRVNEARGPTVNLKGDVPSPINLPPGCAFAGRCPHALEKCRVQSPDLRDIGGQRMAACFVVEQETQETVWC